MTTLRPTPDGRWTRVITEDIRNFYGAVALANSTQYYMGAMRINGGGLLISIQERGCYPFFGYAQWGYVQDKLGLKFEGDARNVADFINAQLGLEHEPQGEYDPRLCRGAHENEIDG